MTERQNEVLKRAWDALYLSPLTREERREVLREIVRREMALPPPVKVNE